MANSEKLELLGDGFYNKYKRRVSSEKGTEWDKIELLEVIEDIISGEWGDEIKKKGTVFTGTKGSVIIYGCVIRHKD